MNSKEQQSASNAEWYFRKDPEVNRFYDIFFKMCRKYNVNWASANEKEKVFIEELTRVTYERDKAVRLGLPLADIRPAFSIAAKVGSAE